MTRFNAKRFVEEQLRRFLVRGPDYKAEVHREGGENDVILFFPDINVVMTVSTDQAQRVAEAITAALEAGE